MALRFGFFNSVGGDRKYDARWFAKYFASFIGNGIFPNPSNGFQVIEHENMTVVVKAGQAWINGYYADNDADFFLTFDNADGLLKRIDRVVLRWNQIDRVIELIIKKGDFASNPVAPALQRDGDYYDLVLADVLISNGSTQITQANITDTRLSNELCGIVHGLVNQVDTETLYQQYLDFWSNWREQQVTEFEDFQTSSQTAFNEQTQTNQTAFDNQFSENQTNFNNQFTTNQTAFNEQTILNQQTFDTLITNLSTSFGNWMTAEQQDFYTWYQGLQNILDENLAATLTAKLQSLEQAVTTHLDSKNQPNGFVGLDENAAIPPEYLGRIGEIGEVHGRFVLPKKQIKNQMTMQEALDSDFKYHKDVHNELNLLSIYEPKKTINYTWDTTSVTEALATSKYGFFSTASGGSAVTGANLGVVKFDEKFCYLLRTPGSATYTTEPKFGSRYVYDFSKINKVTVDFEVLKHLPSSDFCNFNILLGSTTHNLINRSSDRISTVALGEGQFHSVEIDCTSLSDRGRISVEIQTPKITGSFAGMEIAVHGIQIHYSQPRLDYYIDEEENLWPLTSGMTRFLHSFDVPTGITNWDRLTANVNSPGDSFVTFDIFDEYDRLLAEGINSGDSIKHIPVVNLKIVARYIFSDITEISYIRWIELSAFGRENAAIEIIYDTILESAVTSISFDDLDDYTEIELEYIPATTGTTNIAITFNNVKTSNYNYTGTNGNTIIGSTSALTNIPITSGLGRHTLLKINNIDIKKSGNIEAWSYLKTSTSLVLKVDGHFTLEEFINSIQLTCPFPIGSHFIVRGKKEWRN